MTKYDDLVAIVLSKIPRGGITCGKLFERVGPHFTNEVQIIGVLEDLCLKRRMVRFTADTEVKAKIITHIHQQDGHHEAKRPNPA